MRKIDADHFKHRINTEHIVCDAVNNAIDEEPTLHENVTAVDITMAGLGYELAVNGKKVGIFPNINAAVAAIYK